MPSIKRFRSTRSLTVAILLIAVAVWLLAGCIYIPTFNATVKGNNVSGEVGPPQSKKLLRTGIATRHDVERLLGPPSCANTDQSEIAYTWTRREALLVWPLCFSSQGYDREMSLVLTFDSTRLM